MVKNARELNEVQCGYFAENVSSETGYPVNEFVITKYLEDDIREFSVRGRKPRRRIIVKENKIELIEAVDEEYDTQFPVDTMIHPMNELEALYSEADIQKIIENRQYLEGLPPSIKNNPSVSIELPNEVPTVYLPSTATRRVEQVVGELLPIE